MTKLKKGKCCQCGRKSDRLLYFLPAGKSVWLCYREKCVAAYQDGEPPRAKK